MSIVNLSGYKFIALDDLPRLRGFLKTECLKLDLKGTILLAHEGINIVLAGTQEQIDAYKTLLAKDARFQDIDFKESFSDYAPFSKMVVKLKEEIISMGEPDIAPESQARAPAVSPVEFKAWLDEGRDVVVLDTRNTYEIEVGTFDKAIHLDIDTFRTFPEAVAALGEDIKEKTVVTFCTGGVRCEKAAPYMMAQGFKDVYQLDGGILKYFEDCGGLHYHGDCFVFDDRTVVDSALQETGAKICTDCHRSVITEVDHEKCRYCEAA